MCLRIDIIDYLLQLASDVALAVYQFQLKEAVRTQESATRGTQQGHRRQHPLRKQRIQHAVFPAAADLEEFLRRQFCTLSTEG
jgi:hypothetical protein